MKPVDLKGNEKVCKVCHEVKSMVDFPKRGNHRLNSCQPCYNTQENLKARQRYREDPEYKSNKLTMGRKSQWKSRYGITPEQVYETLAKQDNKCANRSCNTDISIDADAFQKRAVIDHDHVTGKFRSLLCDRCNVLLGHIENNEGLFYGLLEYSKSFK